MSIKYIAMCDQIDCKNELEVTEDLTAIDVEEGWGTVYGHSEDYCPEHWKLYCDKYDVDIETGKDIEE